MSGILQVSNENFEQEVLKSTTPVLVDFWAEWCGPCRALMPVLDGVAQEMGAQAKVVKVNVDNSPELAQKYGIRGIPTLIFFQGGEMKKTLVGSQPKQEILQSLKELMR